MQPLAPARAHRACISLRALRRRCDIYSYGVLVWELYHTSVPYCDYQMDQVLVSGASTTP